MNGFLLQFLNVKILMLGMAFYSGYILPHGFHVAFVLAFAAIMTLCAGTGNLIWATLGSALFPLYRRYHRVVNAVMAALTPLKGRESGPMQKSGRMRATR